MSIIKQHEVIEMKIKKHWIVHLLILYRFIKIFVLPLIFIEIFIHFIFDGITDGKMYIVHQIFILYYILIALIWFLIEWLENILDILIITNRRVIAYMQISCFHRMTTTAYLGKIQDVKGDRNGFFANIFGFGSLSIYTATQGGARDFHLKYIGHPEHTAEVILKYVNKVKNEKEKHDHFIEDEIDRLAQENELNKILSNLKYTVSDFDKKGSVRKLFEFLKTKVKLKRK